MAKAAVHAMTMSLAVEWGGYGIRLNAVVATAFSRVTGNTAEAVTFIVQ